MKVLRDGKEIKDAVVIYDVAGRADSIRIKNTFYDIKAFQLVEPKIEEKTKDTKEIKAVQKTPKK